MKQLKKRYFMEDIYRIFVFNASFLLQLLRLLRVA